MNVDETNGPDGVAEPGTRRKGRHLSQILDDIASDESRLRVSVGDLFQAMGDRAFGAMMLIFALPNVVPTPPGTSAILGTPLVVLSAQLMLGMAPWLPRFVAARSMTRQDFGAIVKRIAPWLGWAERMLRPRWTMLIYPPVEYLTGFICLVLAIVLALPIPLGNILPALAICFFSFAILERDGVCIVIGWALAILSVAVVGGVIFALVKAFLFLLAASFG